LVTVNINEYQMEINWIFNTKNLYTKKLHFTVQVVTWLQIKNGNNERNPDYFFLQQIVDCILLNSKRGLV